MEIKQAVFVKSAADILPRGLAPLPEIALVGRSNVGKSSLINCLCQQNKLAKVSATPGKTRLVNYFMLNQQFYLVDLPGYGYAQVSREEKARWGAMIENYLDHSQQLKHLLLLLDIRREPSPEDQQMAYWLQHYGIPCTLVATKADKLSRSAAAQAARLLSNKVGMTFQTKTILFSSTSKQGRKALLSRMEDILEERVTIFDEP